MGRFDGITGECTILTRPVSYARLAVLVDWIIQNSNSTYWADFRRQLLWNSQGGDCAHRLLVGYSGNFRILPAWRSVSLITSAYQALERLARASAL